MVVCSKEEGSGRTTLMKFFFLLYFILNEMCFYFDSISQQRDLNIHVYHYLNQQLPISGFLFPKGQPPAPHFSTEFLNKIDLGFNDKFKSNEQLKEKILHI